MADWVSIQLDAHRIRLTVDAPLAAEVVAPLMDLMAHSLLNNGRKYLSKGSEVWLAQVVDFQANLTNSPQFVSGTSRLVYSYTVQAN